METRCILSSELLYQYLVTVAEKLESRGANDLANKIIFASKFASGSTSELFGEAKLALVNLMNKHNNVLSQEEVAEVNKIISQIDSEFLRVGNRQLRVFNIHINSNYYACPFIVNDEGFCHSFFGR